MEAMHMPEGYKRTEAGVIPSDWQLLPVSKFGEVKRGAGSQYIKYVGYDGVRLIRINELFEDSPVYVSPTTDIMRFTITENDVLFAGTGASAGASYIPKKEWIGLPHSYNAPRIRTNENCSKEFLLHALQSDYVGKQQRAWFVGAAQPFLDITAISNLLIATPPTLEEQRAIAAALSDADALISGLERLIAKKRAIKQGTMQALLQPQAGWEVKRLGEVAEVVGGGTPSTFNSKYWNGGINWFTPTEIGLSKYTYKSMRRITKDGLNNSSAKLLPIGTILLTSRATIGDVSILMMEGCTNQGFQSLITKNGFSNEFLYYLMLTLKPLLIQNASGSTFLEISPRKLKQIEISIPDYAEQTRIAGILADMEAEIEALERQSAKYRRLKQGMMQQLLTGGIRLA